MSDVPTWLGPVIEYREAALRTYGSVKPPATEEQISAAIIAARENGLHLPEEALPFYRCMNGTGEFDLHFYALDFPQETGGPGDFVRVQELVRADGDDQTYYGGGNDDELYGYSPQTGKYEVSYGGDIDAEFATFGEMIEFVFTKQLADIKVA